MAITFVDPYGYLLTACFCDQKGLLNKMRLTEEPEEGGWLQTLLTINMCVFQMSELNQR